MPETSQDVFESLYPAKVPITPDELRKRSNSVNNKNLMIPTNPFDSSIGAESNFWPSDVGKVNGKREHKLICDVEQLSIAPEPYGYKREISHR